MSLSLPTLIDTHCHLDYDYENKTVDQLVQEAHATGIAALVTIGTEIDTVPKIIQIAEKYPNVYFTTGVHPHDAIQLDEAGLQALRASSQHGKFRAIGEIGLDYYYEHSPRDVQIQKCEEQLDLALEIGCPVVIHSRDAEADLLPLLSAYAKKCKNLPGVIHCFTGTEAFGKACIDLGFFISFSGILTFKKSEDVQKAAQAFPLDKLLVETDAPFLAPIPFRGKKCEPAWVRHTALKLAELKNISIGKVAEITTRNAKTLFRIS